MELREQIVKEIMTLVRPEPVQMARKPTIAELEAILNSEISDPVTINSDGSVSVIPPPHTVGDVADAVLRILNSAWQPIETCPKNGTNFLASSPASSTFWAHWANGVVDSSSYHDDHGYLERHATHWMPVPYPVDYGKSLQPSIDS